MDAKREFAKDVAAFAKRLAANILVGFATRPALVLPGEEVSELRPLLGSLFDPDQHRKIFVGVAPSATQTSRYQVVATWS